MVQINLDQLRLKLNELARIESDIMPLAYRRFRALTPKKTGQARRRTRLIRNEIRAEYGYAAQLDSGTSRQRPEGMSEPTREYIKKLVQRWLQRKNRR